MAWADRARTLHVGPELTIGTLVSGPQAGTRYGTSVELLLGAGYSIKHLVLVGAAVGAGLASTLGTPDARALVRVAYAPIRSLAPAEAEGQRQRRRARRRRFVSASRRAPRAAAPTPTTTASPTPKTPVPRSRARRRGCPDADHDGIPDAQDLCPGAKPGVKPRSGKPGCPLDSDNDGIPDAEDLCPNAKPGDKPDPAQKGCPADEDHDGVPDAEDACPSAAPGAHPDPAKPGCPLPDADNDGVPDAEDACPKDAGQETPGDPKANGCPKLTITRGGDVPAALGALRDQQVGAPARELPDPRRGRRASSTSTRSSTRR